MTDSDTTSIAQENGRGLDAWPQGDPTKDRDLALNSDLAERRAMRFAKATVVLIGAAVIGFIGWSSFAELRETATAPGEIVTSGKLRAVQHLEGGIVDELFVKEGELVEMGQPLALSLIHISEPTRPC